MSTLPTRFDPVDDRFQSSERIDGYHETTTRTPLQPRYRRPLTLSEITGPMHLAAKLTLGDERSVARARGCAARGRATDHGDRAPA